MSCPNLDDYEEQTGRIAANLKTIEETALDLDDDYENRLGRVIEKLERIKRLQDDDTYVSILTAVLATQRSWERGEELK
jgi:hypothetical protein